MDYTQFILTVNSSSITILLLLAFILLAATRFKGENGLAATIIIMPNIPVYLYNMSRMLGWHGFTLFMFPISYSVNATLLPLLWLFTVKNFKPGFRFKPSQLLHFIPAIVCLVICLAIPAEGRMEAIVHEMSGEDTWVGNINTVILLIQQFTYFPLIFWYMFKRKKEIMNSSSNAEWVQKEWISQLMILFASLFVIVMTCYVIWPRTDAWLIQILNVIAMAFLVYNAIAHPMHPASFKDADVISENGYPSRQPYTQSAARRDENTTAGEDANTGQTATNPLTEEQMREICNKATDYLITSKAYLNPDISIALLAKDTGIPSRNLSRAINSYLKRNFFEFINQMRVEEAKRKLLELKTADYNIDSIFEECGFRSRSTFFMVFKKIEGKTPATWLKEQINR